MWLTIERLNIWTSGPLRGWRFPKDRLFIYIHHCLKSQSRRHVPVLPWKGIFLSPAEGAHMSPSICHRRASAEHWMRSRVRRQPSTDEAGERCCERKSTIIENNVGITNTPALCLAERSMAMVFFYSWTLFSGRVALIYSTFYFGFSFFMMKGLDLMMDTLCVSGSSLQFDSWHLECWNVNLVKVCLHHHQHIPDEDVKLKLPVAQHPSSETQRLFTQNLLEINLAFDSLNRLLKSLHFRSGLCSYIS